MYKVIDGHRYDTEAAKLQARDGAQLTDSLRSWREDLYRTKTGLYFIHGFGGPLSRYGGESRVIPIAEDQAKQWVEEHCDGETYDRIFGTPEEDGAGPSKLTVMLSAKDRERLDRIKASTGRSYTDLISGWIWGQQF